MTEQELLPITDFLKSTIPFDTLSDEQRLAAARSMEILYVARNQGTFEMDPVDHKLYLVRSGAFEVRDGEGQLLDRLGEGDYFGFPTLLTGEENTNQVQVLEDGLLYSMAGQRFRELRSECAGFDVFFNRKHADRLRQSARFRAEYRLGKIQAVMSSPPAWVTEETSVREAAAQMRDRRISCLLVAKPGDTSEQARPRELVGILTDRDLRIRILAEGLDGETPVGQVMTTEPVTAEPDTLVFEAMLEMSHHNVHHLPICQQGIPVGVVTSTDLIRLQRRDPLHLVSQIHRQPDLAALKELSYQIPDLLQGLIQSEARAEDIGRVLTQITDAITHRLIALAQQQLGPAPMRWTWLAFGSQARRDQAAGSDQDNALLLERQPNKQEAAYFAAFAEQICDGLDACGSPHCPGGIMAKNPKWRMDQNGWRDQFREWTLEPDPKAVMHTSIFFDLRPVAGDLDMGKALQQKVLQMTRGNQIFLALLAAHACNTSPPLGFFRQLVLERDGEQRKVLDLKHKGLVLINDVARVYALATGSKEISTSKRIQAAMESNAYNRQDGLNLLDAQEFLAQLRLENQGNQWQTGQPVNNLLSPAELSGLNRHQLKEAFTVVARAQDGLRLKYARQL